VVWIAWSPGCPAGMSHRCRFLLSAQQILTSVMCCSLFRRVGRGKQERKPRPTLDLASPAKGEDADGMANKKLLAPCFGYI